MTNKQTINKLRSIIREVIQEELREQEHNFLPEPDGIDDIPAVELDIDDDGIMKIQVSAFFHTPDNGKVPLLKDNDVLQKLVMKAIQSETQKAFRKAVHGVLGIPYGLKESDESNESLIVRLRQTPTYKQLLLGSTKLKEGNPHTKRLKNIALVASAPPEIVNRAKIQADYDRSPHALAKRSTTTGLSDSPFDADSLYNTVNPVSGLTQAKTKVGHIKSMMRAGSGIGTANIVIPSYNTLSGRQMMKKLKMNTPAISSSEEAELLARMKSDPDKAKQDAVAYFKKKYA